MSEYEIKEGEYIYKTPNVPKAEDYYDINETAEERANRIYLYSEVIDNE